MKVLRCAVKAEESKEITHDVQLELDQCSSDVSLSIYGTTFLDNLESKLSDLISDVQYESIGMSLFHFARWKNVYQSNVGISDELRYVNDRKKLAAQLGNQLNRPSLLMNKMLQGPTSTDNEVLNMGDAF